MTKSEIKQSIQEIDEYLKGVCKIDNVELKYTILDDSAKVDIFYLNRCVNSDFLDEETDCQTYRAMWVAVLHTLREIEDLRKRGYINGN